MRNQGQVLTKENILETIWGVDGQFVVDNTVSVTINRLRRKIEPDGERQGYIRMYSDWGIGLERKSDEMGNCGATGFRIFMWDDGDVYSEQKTENTGIQ